jgi:hypothetical protein
VLEIIFIGKCGENVTLARSWLKEKKKHEIEGENPF